MFLHQNPPPNLVTKNEIGSSWSIPDHQQCIRCKALRSDDRGIEKWCTVYGAWFVEYWIESFLDLTPYTFSHIPCLHNDTFMNLRFIDRGSRSVRIMC